MACWWEKSIRTDCAEGGEEDSDPYGDDRCVFEAFEYLQRPMQALTYVQMSDVSQARRSGPGTMS